MVDANGDVCLKAELQTAEDPLALQNTARGFRHSRVETIASADGQVCACRAGHLDGRGLLRQFAIQGLDIR